MRASIKRKRQGSKHEREMEDIRTKERAAKRQRIEAIMAQERVPGGTELAEAMAEAPPDVATAMEEEEYSTQVATPPQVATPQMLQPQYIGLPIDPYPDITADVITQMENQIQTQRQFIPNLPPGATNIQFKVRKDIIRKMVQDRYEHWMRITEIEDDLRTMLAPVERTFLRPARPQDYTRNTLRLSEMCNALPSLMHKYRMGPLGQSSGELYRQLTTRASRTGYGRR